jgi:CRP-like cAMP-binding protein
MNHLFDLSHKTIVLQRNEFLNVEACIDTNVYFIERGSVKVFVMEADNEQIIRFGYQNNIIVYLDSFLSNQPSVFYIQAIKKTIVRMIKKQQLLTFIEYEENKKWWMSLLENMLLQQLEREIDILTTSPKDRYERVLARSPQLFQEIPNRYIANYLRMSAETLSRLKKS